MQNSVSRVQQNNYKSDSRTKQTWMKLVHKDLERINIDTAKIVEIAQNRNNWRNSGQVCAEDA